MTQAVVVDFEPSRMFVPLLAGIGGYDFQMPHERKSSMASKACKKWKDK